MYSQYPHCCSLFVNSMYLAGWCTVGDISCYLPAVVRIYYSVDVGKVQSLPLNLAPLMSCLASCYIDDALVKLIIMYWVGEALRPPTGLGGTTCLFHGLIGKMYVTRIYVGRK